MIEWVIGAFVLAGIAGHFTDKRTSAPPKTPNPAPQKTDILDIFGNMPKSTWDVSRLLQLSDALTELEETPSFPAACLTPPIVTEAARLKTSVAFQLMAAGDTITTPQRDRLSAFLKNPAAYRDRTIDGHMIHALSRWDSFLDTVESTPLTPEQRRAVLTDEDATLVLAGAGSGKTSVITAKAAHLIKSGTRQPEEILALAFGKDAAAEMEERMARACDAPVTAWTFHKLAYHIIGVVEGEKPPLSSHADDEKRYHNVLKDILKNLIISDDTVADSIIRWFTQFNVAVRDEWDFKTRHDWYTHVESLNLRTLQGEKVRSFEELLIANWLYCNGVAYEYEPIYEHRLPGTGKRSYQPDFRLTESGVYLEHFGVRKEPGAFGLPEKLVTAPYINREEYLASMEWKHKVHSEFGTTLIKTYSYERVEDRLITSLSEKLAPHVTLKPRPLEEIYDKVIEMGQVDSFTKLLGTFLKKFKAGGYEVEGCRTKATDLGIGARGQAFLVVFRSVLRDYERHLGPRIDFEDMMLRAVDHVESGRFDGPFRHILVDEFQDISQDRARLVQALKAQHDDARVFAVGDDWQSIYRFSGADVALMRRFGATFGGTFGDQTGVHQTVDLGRTFRSVDKIAFAARRFVLQNPAQIEKTIIPAGETKRVALRIVWAKKAEEAQALGTLLVALSEEFSEGGQTARPSVLLLGRYRYERPDVTRLQHEHPSLSLSFKTIHAAKGLEADHVVVLGCRSGRYGFPSGITDDPLLALVSPDGETYPDAEERRIMYVAMTRARYTVNLIAPEADPSSFVREIVADAEYGSGVISCPSNVQIPCGECGGRLLPVPDRSGRVWYRCEHRLMCAGYLPACHACGLGLPVASDNPGALACSHCDKVLEACPKCSDGWLVPRTGRYGDFYSCIRYPACTGKASVEKIAERGTALVAKVAATEPVRPRKTGTLSLPSSGSAAAIKSQQSKRKEGSQMISFFKKRSSLPDRPEPSRPLVMGHNVTIAVIMKNGRQIFISPQVAVFPDDHLEGKIFEVVYHCRSGHPYFVYYLCEDYYFAVVGPGNAMSFGGPQEAEKFRIAVSQAIGGFLVAYVKATTGGDITGDISTFSHNRAHTNVLAYVPSANGWYPIQHNESEPEEATEMKVAAVESGKLRLADVIAVDDMSPGG